MKTSFVLMILVIFIILILSIFYLVIVQKEKKIDSQIENQRKINHNLKVLLKSKLSIFNLSKYFQETELRRLDENDLIIIQKEENSEDLQNKKNEDN